MKQKCLRPFLFVVLVLAIGFASQAAHAAVAYVGTCHANSYPTIQAAVTNSTAATIDICAGTYSEQVMISRNVSLKGIISGNGGAVIITSPSGGLVQNATGLGGGWD